MIDLHVHTIYSDGEHTPLEVLDTCNKRGISTVAITDHNSMEGSRQAIANNPYEQIKVIPGIELSARWHVKGANLHILGYGIDLYNKELNEVTNAVMEDNVTRLKSIVELLKKHYNFGFKDEDLERIYSSIGNIGRPDIAKLCVDYGYSTSVEETFVKFLNPIDAKIVKRKVEFTDKSAIECILKAGGIPCLAHPIELLIRLDELKEYIPILMSYGLGAIEVFQSKHSAGYTTELLNIANEFGLLYSAGSDYHGPMVTPDIELGYGKNNNLHISSATILSRFWGENYVCYV